MLSKDEVQALKAVRIAARERGEPFDYCDAVDTLIETVEALQSQLDTLRKSAGFDVSEFRDSLQLLLDSAKSGRSSALCDEHYRMSERQVEWLEGIIEDLDTRIAEAPAEVGAKYRRNELVWYVTSFGNCIKSAVISGIVITGDGISYRFPTGPERREEDLYPTKEVAQAAMEEKA